MQTLTWQTIGVSFTILCLMRLAISFFISSLIIVFTFDYIKLKSTTAAAVAWLSSALLKIGQVLPDLPFVLDTTFFKSHVYYTKCNFAKLTKPCFLPVFARETCMNTEGKKNLDTYFAD
jgi:hypothetical protein